MAERPVFRDDHDLFREQVRRFIDERIAPYYQQWERDGITPRALWLAAGRPGCSTASCPSPTAWAAISAMPPA
ncbi:acyl-CoA dehydrogenase family protein [Stenotrophomonas maltophilia]